VKLLLPRRPIRHAAVAVTLLACAVFSLTAAGPPRQRVVDYTKYHTYEELTAELRQLVGAHDEIAQLVPIGTTLGGRTIWAVEIANRAGVPVAERPALFVAGNFEGDHLIGSELALFTVDWLLNQYATNAEVKQRIDTQAFYIVPRVNPDAAEAMFASVKTGRRRNLTPYDDDNDARTDEDGPDDLNGDGVISVMRVRDPAGPYMVHPADPRLLRRADASKGESGGWAVYWEGGDDDGDGFYNEDGVGGIDPNRNFQHAYPYYDADAGRHMVSEPETRALMDYIIARRNVAAILTYGESDNLVAPAGNAGPGTPATIALHEFADASNAEARAVGIMRGGGPQFGFGRGGRGGQDPAAQGGRGGGGRRPATTVDADDVEYFRAISEKYRELTGVRRVAVARRPAGAFFDYGYFQFGVPSFSTPGWGVGAAQPVTASPDGTAADADRQDGGDTAASAAGNGRTSSAGAPAARGSGGGAPGGRGAASAADANDTDLRLVRWLDGADVDGFVAWTPYSHPQLGDVEIGGFRPYVTSNPPTEQIAALGAAHAQFALHLSSLFAQVRVARTEVTDHGGGIYRVEVDVENTGYLPTSLAQGVTARSVRPVMVQLGVPPESIVTGDDKTNFIDALAGSGTRRTFQWIVRGEPGSRIELKLASQKSGSETVTLTLR
jgi:Zinc carboxypeptidase